MVDPIGNKASVVALRRIAPAAPVSNAAPAHAVNGEAATLVSTAATLASRLAAQPPVDSAKVSALRRAMAEGSYALDPAAAAARMLALDAEWSAK